MWFYRCKTYSMFPDEAFYTNDPIKMQCWKKFDKLEFTAYAYDKN